MDPMNTNLRLLETRRQNYHRSRRACYVGDRELFDLLIWITEQDVPRSADRHVRHTAAFFADPQRSPEIGCETKSGPGQAG
jgi:hypothetical protein